MRVITPAQWRTLRFPDKVRAAVPTAQELLIEGGILTDPPPGQAMWWQKVEAITGETIDGDDRLAHLETALALGIALGLMLRPEAFGTGGAR
jgi:hypothetical protein